MDASRFLAKNWGSTNIGSATKHMKTLSYEILIHVGNQVSHCGYSIVNVEAVRLEMETG